MLNKKFADSLRVKALQRQREEEKELQRANELDNQSHVSVDSEPASAGEDLQELPDGMRIKEEVLNKNEPMWGEFHAMHRLKDITEQLY